jgi:phosphoribosylcarboxyaminoimidazole (NCAIR) mutase
LLATAILAYKHPMFRVVLAAFRASQTQTVLDKPDPAAAG